MGRSQTGRKVFVTTMGNHDYSVALDYGDLIAITAGRLNLSDMDKIWETIERVLSEMDKLDYLLVSGNPVVSAMCVKFLTDNDWDWIKMLYWDGLRNRYTELMEPGGNHE